ncbi:MAG: EamA family transporter RarD, partial [Gammaproteobacteria bacterium]
GVTLALSAYTIWGLAPLYFKALDFADAIEIVAHRVVWSVLLLFAVVNARGLWGEVRALGRNQLSWLAASGALIACNWGIFIWALQADRLVEVSLGYFINPLVNALLGVLFLRERLSRSQQWALVAAAVGVANEVVAVGVVPWMGLSLAVTFGCYGLVRKQTPVDSAVGLGVETVLLLPLALAWLLFDLHAGTGTLAAGGRSELALLALGGLVTVVPLMAFAGAARRLPLSSLGFFQYLAPTLSLLLAVLVYGEPFWLQQFVTFGAIWTGLIIFSIGALYDQGRTRARPTGGDAR